MNDEQNNLKVAEENESAKENALIQDWLATSVMLVLSTLVLLKLLPKVPW